MALSTQIRDEYYLLSERLYDVKAALRGDCDDIDCDHYIYKELLKKKYGPVLKHSFSCKESLEREKAALLRLLSLDRFRKVRHKPCAACGKLVDTLNERLVGFRKPLAGGYVEVKHVWAHRACARSVKAPKGWSKSKF
jgi:hypothetical protein